MTDIVNLNVGGVKYSVARSTILKYEETMLAKLVSEKWNPKNSEVIFIDRDGENFKYILELLRDGETIVPRTVVIEAIKKDALYFGLPEDLVIKETKKRNFCFQDLSKLMKTFDSIKKKESLQQRNKDAALWVVEQFLQNAKLGDTMAGNCIEINTYEFIHNNHRVGFDITGSDSVVKEIQKIMLCFEEDILSPSSVTVVGKTTACAAITLIFHLKEYPY
jgi:hypothetical protein